MCWARGRKEETVCYPWILCLPGHCFAQQQGILAPKVSRSLVWCKGMTITWKKWWWGLQQPATTLRIKQDTTTKGLATLLPPTKYASSGISDWERSTLLWCVALWQRQRFSPSTVGLPNPPSGQRALHMQELSEASKKSQKLTPPWVSNPSCCLKLDFGQISLQQGKELAEKNLRVPWRSTCQSLLWTG